MNLNKTLFDELHAVEKVLDKLLTHFTADQREP